MKKVIVTTTISEPTIATIKFSLMEDWQLVVVGDKKTPHEAYKDINCIYLSPNEQDQLYPKLSEAIGWNCIQRRNIGFLCAYNELQADVVATVDDDNIPMSNWGKDLLVGEVVEADCYRPHQEVFDPLSVTENNHLWHRGYPIQLLEDRLKNTYLGKIERHVLVQADLWNGDPDIDAMSRLIFNKPILKFNDIGPYCSDRISPFNSQNTFIHRKALPFYAVLPYVGRMDDIWGGYLMQQFLPGSVVYNRASVYQERHPQDFITNLENEIFGYRNTMKFLADPWSVLPEKTKNFWPLYMKEFR